MRTSNYNQVSYIERCAQKNISAKRLQCYMSGDSLREFQLERTRAHMNESEFMNMLIEVAIKKIQVDRYKKNKAARNRKGA